MKPTSTIALPRADTSRQPWLRRGLLTALLLLMVAAPALGGPKVSGTPRALAPLPGDTDSFATRINNRGQVAGRSVGAVTTAVIWNREGDPTPLLPLVGDAASLGEGINNRGEVIGISRSGQGPCAAVGVDTAVVWNRHGLPRVLKPLEGDAESRGYAINNRGTAVGISIGPRGANPAGGPCDASFTGVKWDRHGNPTKLPSPSATEPESFGNGINQSGGVSGFVNDFFGNVFAAAAWDRHGNPTLFPADPISVATVSSAINNRGTVVGQSFDAFFQASAPVWDKHGNLTEHLPPLGADPEALTYGINSRGSVVGASGTALFGLVFQLFWPEGTAVVWNAEAVPTRLPPLPGDDYSYGYAINDPGHAVGHSHNATTGVNTAVIWR